MPTVKVNDITMYYEFHGQGEPLVLINGLGTDISENGALIGELALHHQVLAFDNRGAGRTDKPDAPYTIEMMAGDTAALMDALGLRQAHVLGISMGGRIALALALRHPDKVRGLVLVSTFARQTGDTRSAGRLRVLGFLRRLGLDFSKYKQPHYAFLRQLAASRSYDCSRRLPEINVPTLILHGKGDRIAPLPLAEEIHAGIRGSQMITSPGGHIFFVTKLGRFCAAIDAFLAGVER